MSSEGELLLWMFLFHFLLKVISQWSECVCLEFNLISPISGYAGHIINLLPPWQNIGYLLLWQTIKQNKKGETLTDMQIQTRSPFYVLSLPLIHPIITVSSFRHFSFTRSFFLTNAFLSVSPLFLFICLFTCVLPIVSSFAFSFTHCACLLFPIMLLGFVPMQHFISLIILFFVFMFDEGGQQLKQAGWGYSGDLTALLSLGSTPHTGSCLGRGYVQGVCAAEFGLSRPFFFLICQCWWPIFVTNEQDTRAMEDISLFFSCFWGIVSFNGQIE